MQFSISLYHIIPHITRKLIKSSPSIYTLYFISCKENRFCIPKEYSIQYFPINELKNYHFMIYQLKFLLVTSISNPLNNIYTKQEKKNVNFKEIEQRCERGLNINLRYLSIF